MKKILSIQSHVVCGYVGNRSCVLPMQILGNDVDFINSVQLSNHTLYKSFKGQVLNAEELRQLYDGLKENDLDEYSHITTGYIGNDSFLREVARIISDQKKKNKNLVYSCDPVMGDGGKLYTPANLLEIYKTEILPLADIALPNQFEAELLTGIKIQCLNDAIQSMNILHEMGIKTVIISSTETVASDTVLYAYASIVSDNNTTDKFHKRWRMKIPKFPYNFVGTGDLFSGLFLAWTIRHPNDVELVCRKVLGTMQFILKKTVEEGLKIRKDGNLSVKQLELKIVQCIPAILDPPLFNDIESLP